MRRVAIRPVLAGSVILGFAAATALRPGATAATSRFRPRVVNGVFTSQYPSVGILLAGHDPATASLQCSGTLIGCSTFLTAGHCVEDDPRPSRYLVFFQHAGFFKVASVAMRPDYAFPVGDVAVLKLSAPVTGVAPTPINTMTTPLTGTPGTIVGFGRKGGQSFDYGLKRMGSVTTAVCSTDISNTTSVCWDFTFPLGAPGSNSSTCNGDSGGPLFIDFGAGDTVAGVTSGGNSDTCGPEDKAFDANVYQYASWIQAQSGGELDNTACGSMPKAGDAGTQVVALGGLLNAGASDGRHSFQVSPSTTTLRVAMNAVDDALSDFDLYVKAGSLPTTTNFDCSASGPNQYGFCEFNAPAAGRWYVLIQRWIGAGEYQVTATMFGGLCSADSDGRACDDMHPCTENDVCRAGVCAGVPVADGMPCDDGNACTRPDSCQAGTCSGSAPALGCKEPVAPGQAVITLRDFLSDRRDSLSWKWTHGSATTKAEFGTPTSSSDYTLCIYDETANTPQLITEEHMPAGANWTDSRTGFKYRDRTRSKGGVSKVVLKAGADGEANIAIKGKGAALNLAPLPLTQQSTVTVQLLNESACWEARYSTNIRNRSDTFKAKSD